MQKTDRGKIAGVSCPLTAFNRTGASFAGDALVKSGSDKASLKGKVTIQDGNRVEECTFSAKRTSTARPKFDFCEI
jgi:hypothetical protein